jgi:hypothetical protein
MSDPFITYERARQDLFRAVGYDEDFGYHISYNGDYLWTLAHKLVAFSQYKEELYEGEGHYLFEENYHDDRNRSVFRGERYTLVVSQPKTYGDPVYLFFDNRMELKDVDEFLYE